MSRPRRLEELMRAAEFSSLELSELIANETQKTNHSELMWARLGMRAREVSNTIDKILLFDPESK